MAPTGGRLSGAAWEVDARSRRTHLYEYVWTNCDDGNGKRRTKNGPSRLTSVPLNPHSCRSGQPTTAAIQPATTAIVSAASNDPGTTTRHRGIILPSSDRSVATISLANTSA